MNEGGAGDLGAYITEADSYEECRQYMAGKLKKLFSFLSFTSFSGLSVDLGITAWVWSNPQHPDALFTSGTSGRCWPKVGKTTVVAAKIDWVYSGYVNCP